jgi:uncharacterized membrane protein
MRPVVLSIAMHAALVAIVATKMRARDVVATEETVAEKPRPMQLTEIELYVEPPVAVRSTERIQAHAVRPSRGDAVEVVVPTRAIESPPRSAAADPVVTLPSPHDAAAAANISAPTSKIESAAPAAAPTHTFRMRVDADGTAHLTDRRNFQWGRGGSTSYVEEAKAERWLDEHHEQSNVVDTKMPPLQMTVATFDITDAAMRLAGQDPYAYEKLKVLDATRDERAKIGARHRDRQLLDTPALVRASLADIARLPADQRDAAIRALYLECDDSPAGEVARSTIVEYLRAQGLALDLPPR